MAGACGSGAAEPDPVAFEDYTAQARDAICEWSVRCQHVPDRATCERLLDPHDYDTRRVADAIAGGRVAYDDRAAGACLEATRSGHCLAEPYSHPSCGDVFSGAVEQGGACSASFDCASGAPCEEQVCAGQCCTGVCGAASPPDSPPRLAEVGDPCQTHFDCVVEAYCETDGRCAESPDREGERCLFGCARGDLYCDLSTLTCARYAGRGESCDVSAQSAPPCDPAWSFCDGECRDRPGMGEMCDDADRRCVGGLQCDAATNACVALGTTGDACATDRDCIDVCVEPQCAEYVTCSP